MASAGVQSTPIQYSCACLNVRIRTSPTQAAQPESVRDPLYTPVFVGDEGIAITHPQVTLRTRLRGVLIPGTSRCSRFTTLTCLLCDLAVYRVHQIVPIDVEGKEGPILPTEEWVEQEVMKSSSGWIEVHRDALTGDALARAESSPDYSQTFSLVLPSVSSLPSSPKSTKETIVAKESSSPAGPTISPTPSYLSDMRPLYLPPPYTPSHPAFLHLASLAEKESQALRSSAEEYIANVIRDKISEVERAESELRKKVEILWRRFRESLSKVDHEKHHSAPMLRSPTSRRDNEARSGVVGVGSPPYGTPMAIREFVPAPILVAKTSSPPMRVSALSASLATSSFHHPRAHEPSSPDRSGSRSPNSITSRTLSINSDSSTLVQPTTVENSNILQFRRNTNDTINTAASYRYFMNLEEDMARHKREQEAVKQQQQQSQKDQSQQAGPSQLPVSASTDGNKKSERSSSESKPSEEDTQSQTTKLEDEAELSRGRKSKGKRKVTFDVQPAVVTIKREVDAEKAEAEAESLGEDSREMIFDFEEGDDEEGQQGTSTKTVLQFVEQPPISRPSRPSKKTKNLSGLPASLASLRPASLPAPSHIRPIRSPPGVDSSSQNMMLSLPRSAAPISREPPRRASGSNSNISQSSDKPVDPRDAEILKLVAADIPSHRGAWKTNSKSWEAFIRRPGTVDSDNIPEEDEQAENGSESEVAKSAEREVSDNYDDNEDYEDTDEPIPSGIPASLPVNITIRNPPREVLSLASYQPKTALADRIGSAVAPSVPKNASSTAIRKAAYAERDRSRSMDPGALDFATEEDENEEDDESDEGISKIEESGGRGRKRARKILEKRSEIPDAGMWRSLAS